MSDPKLNVALIAVSFLLCFSVERATFMSIVGNFGPYNICFNKLDMCKGHLKRNLSIFKAGFVHPDNHDVIYTNVTILEDVTNGKQKLRIYKWDGKRYRDLTTFNIDNVCRDSTFKRVLYDKLAKLETVNGVCIVRKGNMAQTEINLKKIVLSVISDKFFYGRLKGFLLFYSPMGNIGCIELVATLKSKSEDACGL